MSETPHAHGEACCNAPAPPGLQLPFTPAEIALFQAEDRKAATAIIGLMLTIFLIGIGLYLIVCYTVA
jgi:hypothetical protein